MQWLKQYKNGWQMKYFVMAYFEIDLDKFIDIFSLNDKETLLFFKEQFELRSGGSLEIADESDLAAMVEQIKAIKPPFIDYFGSRPYAKSSILISKALNPKRLSSTIKDTLMPCNSNVHILAID